MSHDPIFRIFRIGKNRFVTAGTTRRADLGVASNDFRITFRDDSGINLVKILKTT